MAKTRTAYFCQSCGYESAKWLGKCPACSQWNTFVEEVILKEGKAAPGWKEDGKPEKSAKPISQIEHNGEQRVRCIY